jgi:AP-2 complex subunit beta-1
LSTDPKAAKEVVLAEKPLISEETDLLEPTLLDELICHIGTLASVYHKPPNAFVEGRHALKKNLPLRSGADGAGGDEDDTSGPDMMSSNNASQPQQVVFGGNVGSLIDDFDILGPMPGATHTTTSHPGQMPARAPSAVPNLLDDELSSILGLDSNIGGAQTPQSQIPIVNTAATTSMTSLPISQPAKSGNLLDDLFGDLNLGGSNAGLSYTSSGTFALPKEVRPDRFSRTLPIVLFCLGLVECSERQRFGDYRYFRSSEQSDRDGNGLQQQSFATDQ